MLHNTAGITPEVLNVWDYRERTSENAEVNYDLNDAFWALNVSIFIPMSYVIGFPGTSKIERKSSLLSSYSSFVYSDCIASLADWTLFLSVLPYQHWMLDFPFFVDLMVGEPDE